MSAHFSHKARKQRGGSQFQASFYAATAVGGPAAISRATLEGINDAPMFNPLSLSAVIPTTAIGIVPSGLYLMSTNDTKAGQAHSEELATLHKPEMTGGCGSCGVSMTGGFASLSTDALRDKCNAKGISCKNQIGGLLSRAMLIRKLQAHR